MHRIIRCIVLYDASYYTIRIVSPRIPCYTQEVFSFIDTNGLRKPKLVWLQVIQWENCPEFRLSTLKKYKQFKVFKLLALAGLFTKKFLAFKTLLPNGISIRHKQIFSELRVST
jgi:hypothetical protein